ncbi:hypothetical protein ACB092_04G026600 [Castanea dentata]
MVGNVENGGNPRPEEIENIFLTIILQSITIIMAIDDAQLSTMGRVIRSFSMIINLLGFICCAAVRRQPHKNRRVARLLNPRIARILSRMGSALCSGIHINDGYCPSTLYSLYYRPDFSCFIGHFYGRYWLVFVCNSI